MSNGNEHDRKFVRIDLTPEQQEQVLESTGKDVHSIELSTQELEERIAPMRAFSID